MREIGRQDLLALVDAGAQLVEVLPRNEFEDEHLPGAISVPLRKVEGDARTLLDPTRPVIVYCWDGA